MINKYFVFYFLLLLLAFGSCVPNKKIVQLQKEDELKENVELDSILRSYQLSDYEYRIQPEDILYVKIESLADKDYDIFSGSNNAVNMGNQANLALAGYLVGEDGTVQFPEIGKVNVMNLTVHEIEDKLTNITLKYMPQPSVQVRLLNFRITILGEVNRQGLISTLNNKISIIEALGLAGGVTDLADQSRVKIIRQSEGTANVFYINLLDESLLMNEEFFIHSNDIVIVSPLKQRAFRRYFGQNLSLFISTASLLILTLNLINNN